MRESLTSNWLEADGDAPFVVHGSAAASPIILSVPHAGRRYAPEVMANLRVPAARLLPLEDRYADLLVAALPDHAGHLQVAQTPRAMIDLNRDEREIDPAMVHDWPRGGSVLSSAKVRGGLGLIPRFLPQTGELWRRPLAHEEVLQRIASVHRPYHAVLAQALGTARLCYGQSVLIDLHSMPPIADAYPARIVVGDRFGRSAGSFVTDAVLAVVAAHGLPVAVNSPYPGHYVLDRHANPAIGQHAIQIEVDRSLYLASDLLTPTSGVARIQRLIADLVDTLHRLCLPRAVPLAAE